MTFLTQHMPEPWLKLVADYLPTDYAEQISVFVEQVYQQEQVFPPREQIFRALELTLPRAVKVVILGQDPYHNDGQAHGLAFSVQRDVKIPPSLRNIYKELASDIGCDIPEHGFLEAWSQQGVLLLNTVLTVRAHAAASHQKKGWEILTDAIIKGISEQREHVVFVLWGNAAQKKEALIADKHTVLKSVHPSPLSARRGFFGSQPFSKSNGALKAHNQDTVNWCQL